MTEMEVLKIWFFSIFAAVSYGILLDQVTARICVEYFSVFHPTILPLTSPTSLAFEWGILATWWVGAALGLLLAIAARAGSRTQFSVGDLYRPLLILLGCMAAAAFVAGIVGFSLARTGILSLEWLSPMLPVERHARFIADLWAHSASYFVGIIGGLIMCAKVWTKRRKISQTLSAS